MKVRDLWAIVVGANFWSAKENKESSIRETFFTCFASFVTPHDVGSFLILRFDAALVSKDVNSIQVLTAYVSRTFNAYYCSRFQRVLNLVQFWLNRYRMVATDVEILRDMIDLTDRASTLTEEPALAEAARALKLQLLQRVRRHSVSCGWN
jgi:hypothetical protein